MEPIRILYVNGGIMHRGGIESYMMNYYRHIDRTKVQIDFIVHGNEKGVYDDEIEELGGKIYHVPVKSKDYIGNIRKLKLIFKSGKYKIVHSHMDAMSMVVLKIAKQCGIPIRIAHSHNTQHLTNNKLKFILNEYARKNVSKYATHLFACSEAAGKWLFGKNNIDEGNVEIINNAIEMDKFKFNNDKRIKIRKELNLKDEFVIGHIGRFDYQKNHIFLLEIFKDTLKYIPNAKLILIGDGHLRSTIEDKIIKLDIKENVIMLGTRPDISDITNAFDIFLLPSLFEGLPVVAIESQANGLPCLFSDDITKEVDFTKMSYFIPRNENLKLWSHTILEIYNKSITRFNIDDKLISSKYNIKKEAIKLQDMYILMMEECKNEDNVSK